MRIYKTNCEEETMDLGSRIGEIADAGSVILLSGDLGAGKTVLARGIARGLGISEPITSPTYTLLNIYQGRLPLYHFDIYRLTQPEDLYDLDFEEYLYGDGVVLVEWPERMGDLFSDECMHISIEKKDGQQRIISIKPVGEKYLYWEGEMDRQ
jgi:tRNA threonylcarbamoyladenosine biosynthesis protein TsaE